MPGRPSSCQALPWGSRLRPPLRARQLASPLLHSRMASTSYSVERNPYSVLGVAPGVCENTLKAAFRQRALLSTIRTGTPLATERRRSRLSRTSMRGMRGCFAPTSRMAADGGSGRGTDSTALRIRRCSLMCLACDETRWRVRRRTFFEPRGCEHAGASQAAFCGSRGERND